MGFDASKYVLNKNDTNRLLEAERLFAKFSKESSGYPANMAIASTIYNDTARFLQFTLNNAGNPFIQSTIYKLNTHEFERDVLAFFANFFHIASPDYYGYVTTGGTEGNMYGLYAARERYPEGILYYSKDAHYSIPKIAKILKMQSIEIASQKNGEIDYKDFEKKIHSNRKRPAIILTSIGTAMKGAVDNIDHIVSILKKNGQQDYAIHCDAALGGMILPFAQVLQNLIFLPP